MNISKPKVSFKNGANLAGSLGGFNAFSHNTVLFAVLTNFDSIRDNVRNILFFRKGDYLDLPDFGIGLQDYAFEQNDELLSIALNQEIRTQISRYEPRVTVRSLSISSPSWSEDGLVVDIDLLCNGSPLSVSASGSGLFNMERK
jgi:phage baseplate assembly protein W